MAILFVAAEAFELKPLAERIEGLRPLKWPLAYAMEGVFQGKRYLLTANGAGPKLAKRCLETAIRATSMAELSASRLEAVVSTGLCGGLEPALKFRDIVVGTAIFDADHEETVPCAEVPCSPEIKRGVVLSRDRVAITAGEKGKLFETGALAVEMESAGIASRANAAGLPFCCIKVVSDCSDEDLVMDFNLLRSSEGRFLRGKIIVYALTHPATMARLISFRRKTQEAAGALGAFLASCRFQFSDTSSGPEPAGA